MPTHFYSCKWRRTRVPDERRKFHEHRVAETAFATVTPGKQKNTNLDFQSL
jgi:uncharacterized protein YdeI (YjbR/CyaY-like superfamily)